MTERETAREIDDAAAKWAARADAGPLSSGDEEALTTWLAGDTRRLGAYARARAVLMSLDKAKALHGLPSKSPAPRPSFTRRGLAIGAGALAASAVGGVLIANEAGKTRFSTRIGEMRVVPLADGSVVTLNTASRIVVEYGAESREVFLAVGEAIFDVAPDPSRPFIVRVGQALVRAYQTSFSVRRLSDAAPEVLVREGSVELMGAHGARRTIEARQRVVASEAAPVTTVALSVPEMDRELAWRDGRLAFEGETLGEAAQEFARYSQTRLIFEDPSIADETVTGLFVSTDPVGFAYAVASAFGLEAETRDGEVRLRRAS